MEDTELKDLLENYLHKLNTNTLTCDEKMNLIQFHLRLNILIL